MGQSRGHDRDRDPRSEHLGSHEVTQIMQSAMRDAGIAAQAETGGGA